MTTTEFNTNPRGFFHRHNPRHRINRKRGPIFTDLASLGPVPPHPEADFDPMSVHYLPYGVWTYRNGDEILFTRSYKAIWGRRINSSGDMVDCYLSPKLVHERAFMSGSWVSDRIGEEHFRDDGTFNPRKSLEHVARLRRLVADFITGQSIRGYLIY